MRFKVTYGRDPQDYAVCYADDEHEAAEHFRYYNPDKSIVCVERFIGLREMAGEGDEHEFLCRLIEAIEDQELETMFVDILYDEGYGREEEY